MVVGTCIRLHNYCIYARFELTDVLKKNNGWVKIVPGVLLLSPFVNANGVPADQMKR